MAYFSIKKREYVNQTKEQHKDKEQQTLAEKAP